MMRKTRATPVLQTELLISTKSNKKRKCETKKEYRHSPVEFGEELLLRFEE